MSDAVRPDGAVNDHAQTRQIDVYFAAAGKKVLRPHCRASPGSGSVYDECIGGTWMWLLHRRSLTACARRFGFVIKNAGHPISFAKSIRKP